MGRRALVAALALLLTFSLPVDGGSSKLGPHVIYPTPQGLQWARQASIVVQVDGLTALQASPDRAVKVYRHYFADQDLGRLSPEQAVAVILAGLGNYRHPNLYVELLNETYQTLDTGLPQYVGWTRRAVDILHAHGLKVCGFSFSTGQPEREDWLYLKSQNYANVDAVCLHEYWGNSGFTLWHALRHRLVHEWTQGQHPPIILSEIGRNGIEGGGHGWRRSGISAEGYLEELAAYDRELQQDPYVLGAAVFTSGGGVYWSSYDVDYLAEAQPGWLGNFSLGGTAMTDIYVGPGIARAMADNGDRPVAPERYVSDHVSIAFGDKGVYMYSKDADKVFVLLSANQASSETLKSSGQEPYVGPGVRAKMASVGDVPVAPERYLNPKVSVAFGAKGVYFYTADADRVYFIPAR